MEDLTDKQQAVLSFIEEYQMSHGKSPTLKEIREHFNLNSDNSVLKHLKALELKGYISREDTPRGIGLLNSIRERLNSSMVQLPVLGAVPAGGPVLTEEYVESWMGVEEGLVKDLKNSFMLRVTGESMIDAGIYEGDLVIASSKIEPRNGDIVVALIDGGNTLKRFVKENGICYLKAENKNYIDPITSGPFIIPVNELVIQGVVTGLIRTY